MFSSRLIIVYSIHTTDVFYFPVKNVDTLFRVTCPALHANIPMYSTLNAITIFTFTKSIKIQFKRMNAFIAFL